MKRLGTKRLDNIPLLLFMDESINEVSKLSVNNSRRIRGPL